MRFKWPIENYRDFVAVKTGLEDILYPGQPYGVNMKYHFDHDEQYAYLTITNWPGPLSQAQRQAFFWWKLQNSVLTCDGFRVY